MSDKGIAAGEGFSMPGTVRVARVVAWGMAVIGLVCVASAGWLFGARSAGITAVYFVPSWLLGLLAFAFGAVGDGIRICAVLLAVLNMLWTVPSIPAGHPPGWLGPLSAIVLVVLLFRRSARAWFTGQ
ncbi:hypothetical protein [Nocardia macrotermitis]|uniref:Uncharacterized protein n=1 Tax=Nocardia macrotermitis TaxID=2585198 RepID=A0A7K0CXC6_9NOCA|nr:hypothetical protein [Nocardia macrotermitis]MQY18157.1 hypothetical protein [Nocardia macrotermitis]